MKLYGIKNCDTVKKARKYLESKGKDYEFHDVREDGLTDSHLKSWTSQVDWQKLLNTRSTTWRQLDDGQKKDVDAARAIALILEHPTLLKRPVLESHKSVLVGFKSEWYDEVCQG